MPQLSTLIVPPGVRRAARRRGVTKKRVADELSTFVEVKPAPGRWKVAAHITFCVTATMLTISAIFGPKMGLLALSGTFMCSMTQKRPWRHRATILVVLTTAYVLFLTVGVLVSGNAVLTTVALTAISGLSVLIYHALVGDPPGPIFLTIGPAIATYMPTVGLPGHLFVAAAGMGAVMSSSLSLLLQLPNRHDPEIEAVDDAIEACEEYLNSTPDDDPNTLGRLRDAAYASIFNAAWALESAVGRQGRSETWRKLSRDLRKMHLEVVKRTARVRLPGADIAVPVMQQTRYLGRPKRTYLLEWGLSRSSLPALSARRAALSVLFTCVVCYGFGVVHPYWAVMTTALLVSLNGDRFMLTHRAMQRLVGTIAGVGLFFLIELFHPAGWWLIAIALACVFMLQFTVVRNYAIGSMFITPMALLVASAGAVRRPLEELMVDRILETLIACVVSLTVLWVMGRRLPILLVRRQFRRALRALEKVLVNIEEGNTASSEGTEARRDLVFEQLEAAHILQIAQTDLPATLGSWEDVETSLNTVSYVVLADCWTTAPAKNLNAEAMASRLQRLITSLPPVSTETVDATSVSSSLDEVLAVGLAKDKANDSASNANTEAKESNGHPTRAPEKTDESHR